MTTIKINNIEVNLPFFCSNESGTEFYKVTKDHTINIFDSNLSIRKTMPEWIMIGDNPIPVLQKEVEMKFNEAMRNMREQFFGNADVNITDWKEIAALNEIGEGC